jgi:hypothetical protein
MTWTKVGAEFLSDPVMLALPRGARLLAIEATIWANQQSTDGAVPAHILRRITDEDDPEKTARLLVASEVWDERPDGWQIRDFLRDQPSALQVREARERETTRKRIYRERLAKHLAGDHSDCRHGRSPAGTPKGTDAGRDAAPSDRPSDRKGGGRYTQEDQGGAPLGVDAAAAAFEVVAWPIHQCSECSLFSEDDQLVVEDGRFRHRGECPSPREVGAAS